VRRTRRTGVTVALLLMLGLTACSDTSHHPSAESEKVTRTTAAVASSSSTTQPPPPTTTPQPPTNRTATLSVSTKTLTVGQPITVSGNSCQAGYWASASLLPSNPNAYPAIFSTPFSTGGSFGETVLLSNGATRVTAAPNGAWTITTVVPMVFPGPSIVTASCRPPDSATPSGFVYQPRDVSVNTPYMLSVAPGTTVAPGSTLTVQPVGGDCKPNTYPFVALYQTIGTTEAVNYVYGQTHAGTFWQASLVVPSGLHAGYYQLEADCDLSRGAIFGSYAPLQITVE
jgi:hypothetical protein